MLGRSVEISARENNDFTYPFLKVSETVKQSDITLINLENPIVEDCPPHNSGFKFCASPEMINGLQSAGVDIVTLANNHTLNYGQNGIEQTKTYLYENGIDYTGMNNLIIKEINNTTFGFIGFEKSQQGNPKLTSGEQQLVKESDAKVDVLIVTMHWGVEYKNSALPGVRTLAKQLVQDGADVIVGSHPHWVQDVEYLNKEGTVVATRTARNVMTEEDDKGILPVDDTVPVYYSLGNFVFDQMWSEETKKGLAVKLTLEGKQIVKEEFLPIYMKNRGQPEWVQKDIK